MLKEQEKNLTKTGKTMKAVVFIFSIFLSVLHTTCFAQQIEFNAKPSKTEVCVGEAFSVSFNVTSNSSTIEFSEQIKLPRLDQIEGIVVLGAEGFHDSFYSNYQSVSTVVGKKLRLVAEKPGTYKIDIATVGINGKKYKTAPIYIKVEKGNPNKNNASSNQNQTAFLKVSIDNENPYLNEEVILTVKLYARDVNLLRRRKQFVPPQIIKNFYTKAILDNEGDQYRQEKVNDRVYYSEELAKMIVFPQKEGELRIEPFEVQLILSNFFGSEEYPLNSDPVYLEVKPLPGNKPKGFSGVVGQFTAFNVSTDKTDVKSNDKITVDIELIGNGNLNTVKLPKLNVPKYIDAYHSDPRHAFKATTEGLKGKIAEEVTLVPQYGGNYEVEPLKFIYFDPVSETYKTLKSDPIVLNVSGSEPPSESEETPADEPNQDVNDYAAGRNTTSSDESGLISNVIPEDIKNISSLWENPWVWFGVIVLLAVILFLIISRKKTKNKEEDTENDYSGTLSTSLLNLEKPFIGPKVHPSAIDDLKAKAYQNDNSGYFSVKAQLLTRAAQYFTGLSNSEYTAESAVEIMKTKGLNESLISDWKLNLEQANRAKYGGSNDGADLVNNFEETRKIIKKLQG